MPGGRRRRRKRRRRTGRLLHDYHVTCTRPLHTCAIRFMQSVRSSSTSDILRSSSFWVLAFAVPPSWPPRVDEPRRSALLGTMAVEPPPSSSCDGTWWVNDGEWWAGVGLLPRVTRTLATNSVPAREILPQPPHPTPTRALSPLAAQHLRGQPDDLVTSRYLPLPTVTCRYNTCGASPTISSSSGGKPPARRSSLSDRMSYSWDTELPCAQLRGRW